MNGRRANKLRRMARNAVDDAVPEKTSGPARVRLADKLYRSLRRHWMRLNHRERGRFGMLDVAAGLRSLR